jgi:hypothetical protein
MSDESGQSEQQNETTTATTTSDKWGDSISPDRQAELQGYLDRWQAETGHGKGSEPFAGVRLTGADVFWLAEQSGHNEDGGSVPSRTWPAHRTDTLIRSSPFSTQDRLLWQCLLLTQGCEHAAWTYSRKYWGETLYVGL